MNDKDLNLFKQGCRVLMILKRKKDGGPTKEKGRRKHVYISQNEEEFNQHLGVLEQERKEGERIYCSVNARSMDKAIRIFKQRQLDNDYVSDSGRFYLDIKNRFISCITKPQAREEYNFLFDYDRINNVEHVLDTLRIHTEVLYVRETKNGWHIITKPFNHTKLPKIEDMELKTDGLLLLKY